MTGHCTLLCCSERLVKYVQSKRLEPPVMHAALTPFVHFHAVLFCGWGAA